MMTTYLSLFMNMNLPLLLVNLDLTQYADIKSFQDSLEVNIGDNKYFSDLFFVGSCSDITRNCI